MMLVENQIDALIMTAFPQYKLEEIESWTWDEAVKIAAMAEWSLRLKGLDISLAIEDQIPQQLPAPPSITPKQM